MNADSQNGDMNYCPVCGQVSVFRPAGRPRRPRARCAVCGAKERHRLAWCVLDRCLGLLRPPRGWVLHLAPERACSARLRQLLGRYYVSMDLCMPEAMIHGDICALPFPDGVFSRLICSHVLEHVQDDIGAIREMRRVLATGGEALVMVPISAERTFEDPRVTDPGQRLAMFGREDHVRRYGPDFVERLRAGGWVYRELSPRDVLSDHEIRQMAIKPKERLYLCRVA